ncbi:Glutathione-specific gamma-glutamylcyclotransferase [compost metagenome]
MTLREMHPMGNLTRKDLVDGSIRSRLAMPADLSWTDAALEQSLNATLNARLAGSIWVFAYGSLIWNPLIAFDEHRTATLEGWRRSFCIRSISARGTPEQPGRVLGLEPGGNTQGVAYRLPDDQALNELRLLWAREMCSGVYRPIWNPLVLENGEKVQAIVFAANTEQALYEADASVPTVARLAAKAAGVFGSNADYILGLDTALADRGISDQYVSQIAQSMRRFQRTLTA